jgi:hypothetical protein
MAIRTPVVSDQLSVVSLAWQLAVSVCEQGSTVVRGQYEPIRFESTKQWSVASPRPGVFRFRELTTDH